MCLDNLQPEQINHILTEEEGKAWEGDILDVYTAQTSVDVLAGANLMAKYAAAQLAPSIIQLVSSAPVQDSLEIQNKKFDYAEFFTETLELSGWDINSLIVPMTPEDAQRAAARVQAQAKGVADQQLQAQKHNDTMAEINEKGTVAAGVYLVKKGADGQAEQANQTLQQLSSGEGE